MIGFRLRFVPSRVRRSRRKRTSTPMSSSLSDLHTIARW